MDNTVKKHTVVGLNQVLRAVDGGSALCVTLAADADSSVVSQVKGKCAEAGVPVKTVPTRAELGRAAGIDVPAAVTAELK